MEKILSERLPRAFVLNILDDQNETWQGTITLIDRKAMQMTKLPLPITNRGDAETVSVSKETVPFRSLLEMINLIDSALGKKEKTARTAPAQRAESPDALAAAAHRR
jgi:hypothetical protein